MQQTAFSTVGDQQLTVSSSAVRLTVPSGTKPTHALIYVGGGAIRWLGGLTASSTPTASVGILVAAGGYIDWTDPGGDYFGLISNAQFIRVGADATLDVIYLT